MKPEAPEFAPRAARGAALANLVLWLGLCFASALCVAAPTPAAPVDPVPRHPLEVRALVDPDGVLVQLPPLLKAAQASGRSEEEALLYLARANACRVKADWACQRDSGIHAREAAERAGSTLLRVRGLIAESRGRISMQDFIQGERLLGDAERLLATQPLPDLQGDVYLAYSSLSYTLGKHTAAAGYATRGLNALGNHEALPVRVRLLRNRANALAQLGRRQDAKRDVELGLKLVARLSDPKLDAELSLEDARIARLEGDTETQRRNGRRILDLAAKLSNSQLLGLGHEVLGLAALDAGDRAQADRELRASVLGFRAKQDERDERRVLRTLSGLWLEGEHLPSDAPTFLKRLNQLEIGLDKSDQAQAGDDFDARLKYAQQEFDVRRLEASADLAREREATLGRQQRLAMVIAALGVGLFALLGLFYLSQRRLTARLREAVEKAQRSEQALVLSEQRMRLVTDSIPALVTRMDRDTRYLYVNAAAERVFGQPAESFLGRTISEVRGEERYEAVRPYVERVLAGENVSFEGAIELNGRLIHYQSHFIPDRDAEGQVQGYFAFTFDITRLKLAEAELDLLARKDSLTGVSNRRDFEEHLERAVTQCALRGDDLALLCLDLDNFKSINDRFGHPAGDAVIQAFAQRLNSVLREEDMIARLGGDEFMLLIRSPAPDVAAIVADKILAAMHEPIHVQGRDLQVGVSIGIAISGGGLTPSQLMSLADQALYQAKAAGRNTWRHVRAGEAHKR